LFKHPIFNLIHLYWINASKISIVLSKFSVCLSNSFPISGSNKIIIINNNNNTPIRDSRDIKLLKSSNTKDPTLLVSLWPLLLQITMKTHKICS
jgi:hypothetical protein